MVNAINNEKLRKDEKIRMDKIQRDAYLKSAMENDAKHIKDEEDQKVRYHQKLRKIHEENLRIEKTRLESEKNLADIVDRESLR